MPEPPAPTPSPPRRLPSADDFPEYGPNSLASVGQRATARIVDELLLSIPAVALLLLVASPTVLDPEASPDQIEIPVWVDMVAVVIGVIYELVLVAWRGQTLGKLLMGIRVARYADGRTPDWGQSAMRVLLPTAVAAGLVALGLPSLLVALVYLTAMLNPMLRGWHDLAGGSVVVRTR